MHACSGEGSALKCIHYYLTHNVSDEYDPGKERDHSDNLLLLKPNTQHAPNNRLKRKSGGGRG